MVFLSIHLRTYSIYRVLDRCLSFYYFIPPLNDSDNYSYIIHRFTFITPTISSKYTSTVIKRLLGYKLSHQIHNVRGATVSLSPAIFIKPDYRAWCPYCLWRVLNYSILNLLNLLKDFSFWYYSLITKTLNSWKFNVSLNSKKYSLF